MASVEDQLDAQVVLANRVITYKATKTPTDKRKPGWLKTHLECLESQWKLFSDNDLMLQRYAQSDDHKDHEYFAEEVYDKAFLEYNIAKTDCLNILNPGRNQSSIQSDQSYINTSLEAPHFKSPLPPIELPKFSGKKSEWESFKGMFIALVHDVPTFHPILKLQYLARSLEGDAKSHLPSPPLTGDKYEGAWKALNDKFVSKKYLLSTHISTLISCNKMKKSSLTELTRVLDTMRTSKQSIDNLQIPPDKIGELWLIYHISHKLDYRTLLDWEREADKSQEYPTYEEFLRFLEKQVRVMDAAQCSLEDQEETSKASPKTTTNTHKTKSIVSYQAQTTVACILCKAGHYLYACPKFKESPITQRLEICKQNKLCINCLREGHFVSKCNSQKRCFTCHGKHHTQLQRDMPAKKQDISPPMDKKDYTSDSTVEISAHTANQRLASGDRFDNVVLLGTARVQFQDSTGNSVTARALIDPGSEKSFISEKLLTCLSPLIRKVKVEVTGVGAVVTSVARKETTLSIRSMLDKEFSAQLSVYVLDKLTQFLPRKEVNPIKWSHVKGLTLADPSYHKSEPIDYPEAPLAQNTVFGWILVGKASPQVNACTSVQVFHTYTPQSQDTILQKFWEVEEIPTLRPLTEEDEYCEEYFVRTTTRDTNERYVVRLPLKRKRSFVGSREVAIACLLRQEKRRGRDEQLDQLYKEYMKEYIRLGHMELVPPDEISQDSYYVPHHAVPRHGSS